MKIEFLHKISQKEQLKKGEPVEQITIIGQSLKNYQMTKKNCDIFRHIFRVVRNFTTGNPIIALGFCKLLGRS